MKLTARLTLLLMLQEFWSFPRRRWPVNERGLNRKLRSFGHRLKLLLRRSCVGHGGCEVALALVAED